MDGCRQALLADLGLVVEPATTTPEPAMAAPSSGAALQDALQAAAAVAVDHKQRGLQVDAEDLERLSEVRNEIAAAILNAGIGGGHVRPWVWWRESTGKPLTTTGAETG